MGNARNSIGARTGAWTGRVAALLRQPRPLPAHGEATSSRTGRGSSGLTVRVVVVAALTFLGGWLRLGLVGYGRPYVYHPDEQFEIHEALRFAASLAQGNFAQPTSGAGWFFLLSSAAGAVQQLTAGVSPSQVRRSLLLADFDTIEASRLAVALTATLSILLTYRLARLLLSPKGALLAAALQSSCLVDVDSSHWVKEDVPVGACILVAQILLLRAARRRNQKASALAGLAVGVALAARVNAAPLLLSGAVLARCYGAPGWRRQVVVAVSVAIAAYGLVTFRPVAAAASALGQRQLYPTKPYQEVMVGRYSDVLTHGPARIGEVIVLNASHYAAALPVTLGWPWLLTGTLGLLVALVGRPADRNALGAFVGAYLCCVLTVDVRAAYYLLPALPCLAIGAGIVFDSLERRSTWAAYGIAAVVLLGALVPTLTYRSFTAGYTDSRTEAKAWIDSHVAQGEGMAIERFHELPAFAPPVHEIRETFEAKARASRVLGIGSGRLRETLLEAYPPRTYRIISLATRPAFGPQGAAFESGYDWNSLRGKKVRWVVLTLQPEECDAEARSFHHQLADKGRLAAQFGVGLPEDVRRLMRALNAPIGRVLRIYEIRDQDWTAN